MTKLIKILLYLLCVIVTVSGLILSIAYIENFFKIVSNDILSIDEIDTSKFQEHTLISGDIHYVIDCVAINTDEYNNDNTIQYYLIPIKSQNYIVLATQDKELIKKLVNIQEQTQRYLNNQIEDTTLSTYIEGTLISIDDELSQILYDWSNNNSFKLSIDGQVLPYVIYTQKWSSITTISIVGLIMVITGITGFLVLLKVSKKLSI